MRQIVLDTETTGLSTAQGHRIIEIGCIELVNRRFTGREYHRFINPERDIDEGAQRVHGISLEDLEGQPRFADIADELLEFLHGAELIIHNADFDVGFIEYELALMKHPKARIDDHATVLDTLSLARELHPGQRNSLDALCKRYEVDSSKRDVHGALIDAELLALVYLAMTGGQTTLLLDEDESLVSTETGEVVVAERRTDLKLVITQATEDELAAHEHLLDKVADGGSCVWRDE
ncbi:MAG: DNA polymerase III subunit epsilon [Proteobacteria bacterium]|nr:DNA polymerase III subunit epsilon [Pseudomonadota bacterium]